MQTPQGITIRRKLVLITMLTCVVVLLLAGTAFIIWCQATFRDHTLGNLSISAEMIADNCKAALASKDARHTEETLRALRAEPCIVFGCIYTPDGEVFASYHRADMQMKVRPPQPQPDSYNFDGGLLTMFKEIVLDNETIGTICLQSDLRYMDVMLHRSTSIIIVVILFASLMAYLMSSGLQRIISGPILSLAEVAKVVSEKKDYSIRAPKHSNDEVGSLIDAFNAMLEQIQQRDSALLDINEQLTRQVAERRKAEESLEGLNEELQATVEKLSQSNRELQDFTHIAAHDLKTPLRAITTLADWISTDYADRFDEQGKEQVKLLAGRAERMSKLIDGISQYSEIRNVERKEDVDLNMLLSEVISEIKLPENIEIAVENEFLSVTWEKTSMRQVFQNLLSNAVKYMDKPEGQIKVGCVEEDSFWKFSVADNGPGIEEKYFEKIFKIFQTLSSRDEVEGTGIGLSVVKKIVEMYNGKVWVESKPGEGSTFFFTLPKQEREVRDARPETNTTC